MRGASVSASSQAFLVPRSPFPREQICSDVFDYCGVRNRPLHRRRDWLCDWETLRRRVIGDSCYNPCWLVVVVVVVVVVAVVVVAVVVVVVAVAVVVVVVLRVVFVAPTVRRLETLV